MKIFIDEAGNFVIPNGKEWLISCVGALSIPDQLIDEIYTGFEKIKSSWGIKGEVKGRKLNEPEVALLIEFLSQFDILFEVTALDMVMQTIKGLTCHRLMQAKKITKNITEQHKKPLVESLKEIQKALTNLSNQLYAQAVCTFELLYCLLQKSTLYYSQRLPDALGEFSWEVDAKHDKITPYEELWFKILLPSLQSKSFSNPFIHLMDESADYSYFKRYCDASLSPPDHLKKAIGEVNPFYFIKISEIFRKNLSFKQSHESIGIQLADILTTTLRRAMNGNLKVQGWGEIGKLMVQSERAAHTIQLIDLCGEKKIQYKSKKPPYWQVMPLVDRTCKQIL